MVIDPTANSLVAGELRLTVKLGPTNQVQGCPLESIPTPSQQLAFTLLMPPVVPDQEQPDVTVGSMQRLASLAHELSALTLSNAAINASEPTINFFICFLFFSLFRSARFVQIPKLKAVTFTTVYCDAGTVH